MLMFLKMGDIKKMKRRREKIIEKNSGYKNNTIDKTIEMVNNSMDMMNPENIFVGEIEKFKEFGIWDNECDDIYSEIQKKFDKLRIKINTKINELKEKKYKN